jgi:deoxycytidylate deaminase
MTKQYNFDWAELAFGSKKSLKELNATFIAAPREISSARFTQLVKGWLPKGNIVLGVAAEDYIDGFEGQPHFRTLKFKTVQNIIEKVNNSKSPHNIYTLTYFQRDLHHILEKITFKHHLFVNGSWHKSFHTLTPYYTLVNKHLLYDLISPFANETEAKTYTKTIEKEIAKLYPLPTKDQLLDEKQMMQAALGAAAYSFDYAFQTGVVLGRASKNNYRFLAAAYNAVVPFQGYAMHHGAARETHFSPPHDVNHYDTVHAEVALVLRSARLGIDLKGTSLFISTLPCPTCSRMLSQTDIVEFIYQNNHSEGYAIAMLESSGKIVRRLVPKSAVSKV